MDQTKNLKLSKESEERPLGYDPRSDREKEVVGDIWYKFDKAAQLRNQSFQNFDGLTLTEYIEDSHRRTSTNIDERDGIEDWQSTIHDPFTRNKVMAILAKMAGVLPSIEVQNVGDDDHRKAGILGDILEWSDDQRDDFEDFSVKYLFEAIEKGTAIGYEGHEEKVQKIRDIVSGFADDLKVKEGKKITNTLFSKVIRLEDFYPSNIGVSSVKLLPYCFIREVCNIEQFRMDYAMYSKAPLVEPKNTTYGDKEPRPYYLDYVSDNVPDGSVEVIQYFNKDTDEYIITANGIWLNELGNGIVSPLPFAHKELPFYDLKFELYDVNFFYGKSLPDKLKNMQDVLNVLTNMMIDQSFLTIFAPMLVNGSDSIEDDYLRPGRRIPIDTQGLPLRDSVMTLDMQTPNGWHQYILSYTRKIMEEASIDSVSSGQAGVGGRTTAQEIRTAAEGVTAILDLFARFVRSALKRRASLRIKNIQQFWTNPKYPVLQRVLGEGEGEDTGNVFNSFKIRNTRLSNGKRGTKIVDFYKDPSKRPTAKELEARALVAKLSNKVETEYMALDPGYIRDTEFDVKLVANRKLDKTKEVEQALNLEKVRVYREFFPGMTDDVELLVTTAELFGDDPTKVIKPDVLEPQQSMAPGQTPGGGQQPGGAPINNVAQNTVNGMTGTGAGNSPIQLGR